MTKDAIIEFLQGQLDDVKPEAFDLEIFKSSVGNALKLVFGDQSPYYKQVVELQYLQKNSLEELYPKKINDVSATAAKASQITKGLIQQLNLLDDKSFKSVKNIKADAVTTIKQAMQNHLTGSQINHLKNYSEMVLRILAEILSDKDIWLD